MPRYVIFPQPAHLISALYNTTAHGKLLDSVIECPKKGFAVDEQLLGPQIQHLIEQHNWQVTFRNKRPAGRSIFLWELLNGMWSYSDPYQQTNNQQNHEIGRAHV